MFGVPMWHYLWVHQMLDSPFVKIFGKKHRRILHSAAGVQLFTLWFGPEIGLVAYYHILLDRVFTALRRKKHAKA